MHIHPLGKNLIRATDPEFSAFRVAYGDLLVARAESQHRRPGRDGSVTLAHFHHIQLSDNMLLWMLYQAHVEHLLPARKKKARRAIVHSLLFVAESCFALTDLGEAFGSQFLADAAALNDAPRVQSAWDKLILGPLLPNYHAGDRVFGWGRHTLKRFRQLASNQELVVQAFEEQYWAEWINDPLLRIRGKNAKIRVHDTTGDLNRRQSRYLVHFKGDGTGLKMGWEYQ